MKGKVTVFTVLMLLCQFPLVARISNVYGRGSVSLNGEWRMIVDPQFNGLKNFHGVRYSEEGSYFADRSYNDDRRALVEYDFDSSLPIMVPGDWNTQHEKLYYYEGNVWYRTRFRYEKPDGCRTFLYFGAVNYQSEVALNKKVLGTHKGGFTPFEFEVTGLLEDGDNSLVVRVDNSRGRSEVPTVNFDWWNYGGITRDVLLVTVPETFIRDYSVSLDPKESGKINCSLQLDGVTALQNVTLSIPELKIKKTVRTDASGRASFSVKAKPRLWCPEDPKLYDVTVSCETDAVSEQIGFRTISVDGPRILLNGKPVFLKGIALHEETVSDNPGRVTTVEQARKLLSIAKDLNCNFLRLTHYTHNELLVREAEKMGLMVWDEIPCYWAIDWTNPETYDNAENQMLEMMARDRNRANVIIWSVANETPQGEARLKFLTSLISKVREMDNTRLVSAALLTKYTDRKSSRITVADDLMAYTDILAFNEYVGWYDGAPEHCDEMKWEFPIEKPVLITEFGAGALYGMEGPEGHRFSELHQEKIFKGQVAMFSRIPNLCGTCPWVLKDFRSPRRLLAGVQDEYNRKGLVDEKGNKKKAFEIMQKYYSTK